VVVLVCAAAVLDCQAILQVTQRKPSQYFQILTFVDVQVCPADHTVYALTVAVFQVICVGATVEIYADTVLDVCVLEVAKVEIQFVQQEQADIAASWQLDFAIH
jgi:hypothetical protein